MKKLFTILIAIIAFTSLSAQSRYRGVALGADRDTLKFIIASPFDNWYINVGGGLQTFIGNEIQPSARHNKLNFNAQVELGKYALGKVKVFDKQLKL